MGFYNMSFFDKALEQLLKIEGGYVKNPLDKGGATNYGISLRFLQSINKDINGDGHVNEKDVLKLTEKTANIFYRKYFWDHYKLNKVESIMLSIKFLDLFVHMRSYSAALIIQYAINASCAYRQVIEDGIFGPKTIEAVNKYVSAVAIRSEQANAYRNIVVKYPSQQCFLKGWINRAYL